MVLMDINVVIRPLFFIGILIHSVAYAQYLGEPKPLFYISEINKSRGFEDHYTFLNRDIPGAIDCKTTWGVLHFRVTGSNRVDTIIYNGSLKKGAKDRIIKNIYSTQGHWKMPRGTKRTHKYWFVYSYFNFGPYAYINPNCGEFDSILQKNILELAESMITISRYTGNKGRFILMPTLVGSEYPTE